MKKELDDNKVEKLEIKINKLKAELHKMHRDHIDEFHINEALHTAHICVVFVHDHLLTHPAIQAFESLTNKVEAAIESLNDAYQKLGVISYNRSRKKEAKGGKRKSKRNRRKGN